MHNHKTRALKCQTLGGAAKTNAHCTHVQLLAQAKVIVQSAQDAVEVHSCIGHYVVNYYYITILV